MNLDLELRRATWATWRPLGARASDGWHAGLQARVRSPLSARGEVGRPGLGWVGLQPFKVMQRKCSQLRSLRRMEQGQGKPRVRSGITRSTQTALPRSLDSHVKCCWRSGGLRTEEHPLGLATQVSQVTLARVANGWGENLMQWLQRVSRK